MKFKRLGDDLSKAKDYHYTNNASIIINNPKIRI